MSRVQYYVRVGVVAGKRQQHIQLVENYVNVNVNATIGECTWSAIDSVLGFLTKRRRGRQEWQ